MERKILEQDERRRGNWLAKKVEEKGLFHHGCARYRGSWRDEGAAVEKRENRWRVSRLEVRVGRGSVSD